MSKIISFSADDYFADNIDAIMTKSGYKNRSRFLRDAAIHFAEFQQRGDLEDMEDEDEVKWISLCKSNGLEGYSCYLVEGHVRQDGYFVTNLDTQTGTWQTEIFEESKELSEDDFYDKYEEYM